MHKASASASNKQNGVSKQQLENVNPQEDKNQPPSTKKRKYQNGEPKAPKETKEKETGPKRLKKLKDVAKEEGLDDKVTIKLPKEEKLVSYEEQAANFVSDKLDKFRFGEGGKPGTETKKNEKFKFVDDSKKTLKTLDAWKTKTEGKSDEKKPEVKEIKKEVKEEKKEIDPKAYFAMFNSGASKKTSAEKPKASVTKTIAMELEEAFPQANKDNSTKSPRAETKANDVTTAKEEDAVEEQENHQAQSDEPTIQRISELSLEESKPKEPVKEPVKEAIVEAVKEEAKPVRAPSPEKAKPTPKEAAKTVSYRPFAGLVFAVVGVMNSVDTEELISTIKSFGGTISEEVDESVDALVIGTNMEDGSDVKMSAQYEAASWLDIRTYNEIEFDQYLFTKTGKRLTEEEEPIAQPEPESVKPVITAPAPLPAKKDDFFTSSKPKETPSNAMQIESSKPQAKPIQTPQPKEPSIVKKSAAEALWTDRYAPKNIGEIIGNQDMVRNLMTWLKDWEDVVMRGNKKAQKFDGRQGKDSWGQANLNAKACLVSGPPGIGKTTSVRLIAKTMGYEVVEQNASDVRNKSAVEGHLNHLTDNTLVSFTKSKAVNKKFLIIMDEVDGMSSGDRGGNQVLINAIKNTKTPIICVCNDRNHPKVRSLANHCYDLRYKKPEKAHIVKRLKEVITAEKLNVDINSLEYICENFGNDIRQLINFLQMHAKRSNTLSYNEVKGSFSKVKKDQTVMTNNFDAAKMLMGSHHDLSLRDKIDLFFIDYDLIPLLIQENYVSNNPRAGREDLERIAVAADMISTGDVLSRSIRVNGEWGLLPNYAFMGGIFPCEISNINIGHPKFPEWLGKNSSQRKRQREVKELRAMTSAAAFGATSQGVLFDYSKGLVDLLNYNLQNADKNTVEEVVEIMDHYNISPEVIKEHLADVPFPPTKDPLSAVPTQIKTALTKCYNSKYKSSVKATKSKKTAGEEGGAKRFNALAEDEEGGGEELSDVEEGEANEEEDAKMEVEVTKISTVQKNSKQKGKGKESKPASSKKKVK